MKEIKTGTLVIAKIIKVPKGTSQEEFTQKIAQEPIIMEQLNHPNIVEYKGISMDHHSQELKIYMEYCSKGTLAKYLEKYVWDQTTPPESEVLNFFTQLCSGLQYLHSKNFLHRDLKPDNVLISEKDIIKICDFGLASPEKNFKLEFCGTRPYIAPEVYKGEKHSKASDIWALGCILYELCAQEKAFAGFSDEDFKASITKGVYDRQKIGSKEIIKIIDGCLRQQPEKRLSISEICTLCEASMKTVVTIRQKKYAQQEREEQERERQERERQKREEQERGRQERERQEREEQERGRQERERQERERQERERQERERQEREEQERERQERERQERALLKLLSFHIQPSTNGYGGFNLAPVPYYRPSIQGIRRTYGGYGMSPQTSFNPFGISESNPYAELDYAMSQGFNPADAFFSRFGL